MSSLRSKMLLSFKEDLDEKKIVSKTTSKYSIAWDKSNKESILFKLTDDLNKYHLSRFFSVDAHNNILQSCKRSYLLFHGSLLLKNLLQNVVYGNLVEVKKIILLHPELLLLCGSVKDYSGRIVEGTALQLALAALDVSDRENEPGMTEIIQYYLKKLPDGETKIADQICKQFPVDYEEKEAEKIKNDSVALNRVVDAIAEADHNCHHTLASENWIQENIHNDKTLQKIIESLLNAEQDLFEIRFNYLMNYLRTIPVLTKTFGCIKQLRELYRFRNYLQLKCKFDTGLHFNPLLLIEFFQLYEKNYEEFGGWLNSKNIVMWRNILGYIQRFLTARIAFEVCQGPYYIVEENEKLKRDLKFRNRNNEDYYFPLDTRPNRRLGYHYAIMNAPISDMSIPPSHFSVQDVSEFVITFNKLYEAKMTTLKNLINHSQLILNYHSDQEASLTI